MKKPKLKIDTDLWWMDIALEMKQVTDAFIKWLLPPTYFDKEVPNGEQLCYRLADGHSLIHKRTISVERACYEKILNRAEWTEKLEQKLNLNAIETTVQAVKAFLEITECEVDEVFSLVPCDFMEPKEVKPAANKMAKKFQMAEGAWAKAKIPAMANIMNTLSKAAQHLGELEGATAHKILLELYKELKL